MFKIKKRILYWTQLFYPYVGGVEVLGTRFIPTLEKRGFEFIVVTSHGSLDLPDEDEHNGIKIFRLPFQTALREKNFEDMIIARRRLQQIKQTFKPDIVHFNFTDPSIFFHWQTQAAHPAKTIVSIRLAVPSAPASEQSLLGQTFRNADWITTNSRAMLADVRQAVPETVDYSSTIYNGLEQPKISPDPVSYQPLHLLAIGRVVPEKGFDVALAAMPEILAKRPDARLTIAGDGPEKAQLEKQVETLGVQSAVNFTGWVTPEKVYELINGASLVVVPSRWREAFGLVALQASQMARPVVATEVGGLPEVVANGQTGLIVAKENPTELAKAVLHLADSPEQSAKMGIAGRERAKEMFNWDKHIDEYEQLYQRLLRSAEVD